MCIQGRYGEFGNLSQPQLRLGNYLGGETSALYRPVTLVVDTLKQGEA
jgi:hypothetical protein